MNMIEETQKPSGLIDRIKGLLLQPSLEWDKIKSEPATPMGLITGYVMIVAAIPAIANFVGSTLIGVGGFGLSYKVPMITGAIGGLVAYGLSIIAVFVLAFLINALAPNFGAHADKIQSFKVAAYTGTAAWLAGVFSLIPLLSILGLLGLYSLYILYRGLPRLMGCPEEKATGYTAVVVVLAIIIQLVIGTIGAAVIGAGTLATGALGANTSSGLAINTPEGKVTLNQGKLDEAAKKIEQAAKSIEDGTVKPAIDAAKLEALLPATINGAAKSDVFTSSGGAANMSTSNAGANYSIGEGRIRLELTDIGALGAMAAIGTVMNVQSSSQSGSSYQKTTTKDGRIWTESYDSSIRSGSYSVIVADRINVTADGTNIDMAAIKSAIDSIDMGQIEALAK
jgi:hypothetical protein